MAKKPQKKKWVPIVTEVPYFRQQELGETYVATPEDAIGRPINVNLMYLLNDPKKQTITIRFRITKAKGEKVVDGITGLDTSAAYLKRLSKMSKGKAEQSLALKTKDNVPIRIKVTAFVKHKSPRSTLTAIRKTIKEFLEKETSTKNFDKLMQEIILQKTQKDLYNMLKKTTRLTAVLVRAVRKLQ